MGVLTLATLLVQGYHPLAEDGGVYVAGIQYTLDRSLFPHFTEFVTEHLRFSIFAPAVAALVRFSSLPLSVVLILLDLASIALTLTAGLALLRRTVSNQRAQLAGIALFGALWTLPVAGTSLLLMDPYVTARSFSTPLAIFALGFALDSWRTEPNASDAVSCSAIKCIGMLCLSALLHPLMAGYAAGLVIAILVGRSAHPLAGLSVVGAAALLVATVLQLFSPRDSHALVAASLSRYYWFLERWHWYELLGLIGPLIVFAFFLRWNRQGLRPEGLLLCRAAIALGSFASFLTLLFAHEHFDSHVVARLQPLRSYLLLYGVMVLLLGASIEQAFTVLTRSLGSPARRMLIQTGSTVLIIAAALGMFVVQRDTFRHSNHLELPWRAENNPNPWLEAFRWCRQNTPREALFALDADYITQPGEDAQTFGPVAQRSALPDFSKDGGKAAITPSLAEEWAAGVAAQTGLSRQTDSARQVHLAPFGVDWMILAAGAPTRMPCLHNNGTVKVCRLIQSDLHSAEQPFAGSLAQHGPKNRRR